MAKRLPRNEQKQDNVPTNTVCPRCSNPTKVHSNLAAGSGRVFCQCGWDDAAKQGAKPVQISGGRDPRNRGVEILGQNEGNKGVTILGGNR